MSFHTFREAVCRSITTQRQKLGFTTAIFVTVMSIMPGWAEDGNPSTITVPYSSESSHAPGDAISIAFPYAPLGRCITFKSEDVQWDTGGAISSEGKIALKSQSDENKRTTNIALGFQTSGKIKAGIFSANSKFDTDISTESFRQDAASTITLEFSASADYGRRMIRDFKVDPTVPSFATNLSDFLARCGTHFIRGERRASNLTILVRISTSSQQGKDALTARLTRTLGGGVSIKAITGEAGATFTATYKSIIEYAKRAGQVSVEYRASGGPGIAAAGASAKIMDPADFAALSAIASNVSSLFTQDNSAVTSYLLQPNTSFGAPSVTFDLSRIEQIGTLTRRLIMLSEAAERYDVLETNQPTVYTKYFKSFGDKVDVARAELVQLINNCSAGGSCAPPQSNILNDLLFLEDLFSDVQVSLTCQYQPADMIVPVVNSPSETPEVLETISLNVSGRSRHAALIDFTSTSVSRLTIDNVLLDETAGFSGFAVSSPDATGEARVFGTVFSANIVPKEAIRYDAGARKYIIDTSELQRRREEILGSAFLVFAPGPNGVKSSYDIGFPPRQDCPVLRGG